MEEDGKFIKGLICGVLLVLLCMAGFLWAYRWKLNRQLAGLNETVQTEKLVEPVEEKTELQLEEAQILNKLEEIQNIINLYYLEDVDTAKVENDLFEGMLEGLEDPYSVYYSEENLAAMEEAISGTYSGIGVLVSQNPNSGEISVVNCFDNTPASEVDIRTGDLIKAINGEDTADMDLTELVSKIKTLEGDTIILTISRQGESIDKEVERRDIEVPTVISEIVEEGIGYMQIVEFDSVTVQQFKTELAELEAAGMEKLVIDVRDNPGGILQVVCDILDQILPEGRIVYTEDKYGKREEFFSDDEEQFEKPLVVLVNENSASAAEIFAGAIQDYGIGTLVGTTTFGKGIVQRPFNFSDGTGIKLTIAKYYTPNGNDIHNKGIVPDREVPLGEDIISWQNLSREEDSQYQEALKILRNEQ